MFRSIRYKLITITVLTTVVCAVLVFFLSIREHENLYRQSVEQNLEALSANMADNLLRAMTDEIDFVALTEELLSMDRYANIKFVNVFNAEWELLQAYAHPNYLQEPGFHAQLESVSVKDLPFTVTVLPEGLVLLKPIGEANFAEGYLLVVHEYEKPLAESRRSLFLSASPLVALSIAIAILASIWFYRRLLYPLSALSLFTRKVEHTGNYALKIDLHGDDEVGRLSQDINSLLEKINTETQLNKEQNQQLLLQQDSMYRLANYDTLTGLPNRTFFIDLLKIELERAKRENFDLAMIFFDVDGFKSVNDRLGHETGDQLLKKVCALVQECLREGDILARLGGDEFLILIPNLFDQLTAVTIADRFLEKLSKPLHVNGWDVHTGVSIGISKAKEADFKIDSFISNADIAMYTSKEKGKGRRTVFNQNILNENRRKIQISNLISEAIALNELALHYQIKIAADGSVDGLEALIRWHNKELGYISPAEFIPIAEQGGKIKGITEWVVLQVFSDMKALQEICSMNLVVSLNVSTVDLQDLSLTNYIDKKMSEFGIEASHLQIEITESSFLVNFERSNVFFESIHRIGGSVALDDFGTGYSSLSYLTRINIDTLKIDREFVSSLDASSRDSIVLDAILSLAQQLGLKICCEGVETAEQARYLLSKGSDHLQGYYFAKPVAIMDLPRAIAEAERLFAQL